MVKTRGRGLLCVCVWGGNKADSIGSICKILDPLAWEAEPV